MPRTKCPACKVHNLRAEIAKGRSSHGNRVALEHNEASVAQLRLIATSKLQQTPDVSARLNVLCAYHQAVLNR